MAVRSANELKKVLFDAYDGFADKRIKKMESGDFFFADDRKGTDYDARGELFLWFCQIGVRVIDTDTVQVTFRGDIPQSAGVTEWFRAAGARKTNFATEVTLKNGQQKGLLELAQLFKAIVRPGKRYAVPSYKYVCPRSAASLRRLVEVLDKAWQD